MNCTNLDCMGIEESMIDYLDQSLAADEISAISKHISQCAACQKTKLEEEDFRAELKTVSPVEIDISFKQSLLDQITDEAVKTSSPNRGFSQKSFFHGFGAATAAAFVVWMFVGLTNPVIESKQTSPEMIIASINEVKNIRLAFNAPANFKNVTMVIELPEFAELEGYEGQRIIRWNTSLADGKNILNLPIVLKSLEQGQIIAKIIVNNKAKTFRVPLGSVIEKSQQNFKLAEPITLES